ncbi:hypothetical protein DL98DRAFT_520984 [Cadophora sp. DSE1049]|nr:hypothetical protein DL98DRAFT_520984 [Cadophora sp. DSE1049]
MSAKEPFPGGMFSTEDNGSAWGVMSNQSSTAGKTTSAWDISNLNGAGKVEQVSGRFDSEIQDYVSSSDSDTGGAKLDIDWDVYKTAYIQTKLDHKSASATSPKADAKSSVSSTGESDKENMDGDTKKEGHAQDGDDVSAIINGVLSHATKKVTFNKAKPMSLGSFFQEDTTVYDGAAKSNRSASTRKAAKTPSSVRYADMKSTSISRTKIPKSSLQQPSAVYNSRFAVSTSVMSEYPANKSGRLRSHVLNAGACGQLDGIDGGKYGIDRQRDFSISEEPHSHQSSTQTRRRGSRRASILQPPTQDNGWIEFRDPKHAQTSPPAAKHSQNTANTITAENDAKKSAALKAWANFPAQAAKEDREAAAAYEAPVTLGLITNTMAAAPVIKETYKKVIVSDRFERKVVEKRVDIIQ